MVLIAGLCEARLRAAVGEHAQRNVQKLLEPAPEQAEVVARGGEHGVDAVAVAAREMVAARPVAVLEMADHRLDGGASRGGWFW